MEVKDWLNGDGFVYVGRILAESDKSTYQYTYHNEKLEAINAEVVLWFEISDNMCINVLYRINPGDVSSSCIYFWSSLTTMCINIDSAIPLGLKALPIDSSSVVVIKGAVEGMLQSFYAVVDSYMKDSKKYKPNTYEYSIYSIAKISVMLTDKSPLDWFTLPDGAELTGNVAKLAHYRETMKAQDNSDMCAVLENAIQVKQIRLAVLRGFFKGNSLQECMKSANEHFNWRPVYKKFYIPVMRKFFKDEVFFSENYIDYPQPSM